MFQADTAMPVVELGQAVEERGFESLFFPDHTHIPAARQTPWPAGPDRPLPDYYACLLDVFVAMAAVAVTTRRIKIGSMICLIIERDPTVTAKEVASIDWL